MKRIKIVLLLLVPLLLTGCASTLKCEIDTNNYTSKIKIKFEDDLIDYISKVGYDSKKGARPLKRAIQSKIEDKFADYIIEQKIDMKDDIIMSFSKEKNDVVITRKQS